MPYQNDMMSLADVVGPATAAGQAMTQDDLQNQKEQMANQVYQQQMPALGAEPGLKNLFTQAQTGAESGIAAQQQAEGQKAQALLPGGIQAGQAENQTKYNAQKLQQFGQMGQIAGQIAGMMDNIPEAARPAAMNELAQKYGINPADLGPLANGDPDQLRQFSQKVIQGTAQYQQSIGEINAKGVQQQINTQLENQGRLANTEAIVGGRTQVANINSQTKLMLQKTDNIIASLTAKQAAGTLTQQEAMTLNQARQAQQLVRTNPFINNMLQDQSQGTPNQMPQATAGPNSAPTTQAPAAAPQGGNAVEAEMRRRGLIQ